jgi:predicted TIM-barrel fold metal-dependent hydrolase
MSALLAYLTTPWRRKLEYLANTSFTKHYGNFRLVPDHTRAAVTSSSGGPESLGTHHLDRLAIQHALLIDVDASSAVQEAADPELSAVLASAFNDLALDTWTDPRWCHAIVVPPRDAVRAADEVRRLGSDPRVAGVLLPMIDIALGERHWRPVFEAAIEHGLPIVMHVSGGEIAGYQGMASYPIGPPDTGLETIAEFYMLGESAVASLVMKGVFERYTDLKFLFCEYGFAWVPALKWRMDDTWRYSRAAQPWLKRWPHEVLHDHVWLTTQPVPQPLREQHVTDLVEDHLRDNLVFSSGCPDFDCPSTDAVLPGLCQETRTKVFADNARAVLRLPVGAPAAG